MKSKNAINKKREQSRFLAISAIMSALGVLILYLGAVIDVLDLSSAALASLIIVLAVVEMKGYWPYLIWLVVSSLAILLLPNKVPAILFLLFAGIYPIIKAYFEKMNIVLSWVCKLALFNIALTGLIAIIKFILILPDSDLDFTIPIFVLCNITFVLYDIAISKLVTFYFLRLRKLLGMEKIFR